ncbi:MAG: hypothetical protein RR964_09930 [Lachnospiraceae bacterium]
MNIIKKYQFWVSVIFAVVFFIAIYPLSVSPYTAAYYVLVFNAISIIGFAVALYYALTKSFTRAKITQLLWAVSISALPHLLFALLSYGSWVCLGGAIIVILLLLLKNRKVFKQ